MASPPDLSRALRGGVFALIAAACGGGSDDGGAGNPPPPAATVRFVPAFEGESFSLPVKLVQHPTNADRWYVVEQRGKVFTLLASNPAASRALAVDVEALFDLATGGEEGLLGMAFAPDFATGGEVFFAYTERSATNVDSVLARFESADGGLTFAPAASSDVMRFDSQQSNHNGGDLAFGPDGFLYYAMGDGGGAGDPDPEDGQNLATPYGKILRLDVRTAPYASPPDNPFVGSAGRDEIWAYGFRNPWRMSFDAQTGELWVGDVGQSSREEIDRVVKGGNFGWDCREGDLAFDPDPNCTPPFVDPVAVHDRSEAQSITGGYVYRGSALPSLANTYVYGDFITGRVFAYRFQANPPRVDELTPPAGLAISSFGQGRDGEIYVLDYSAAPSIYALRP